MRREEKLRNLKYFTLCIFLFLLYSCCMFNNVFSNSQDWIESIVLEMVSREYRSKISLNTLNQKKIDSDTVSSLSNCPFWTLLELCTSNINILRADHVGLYIYAIFKLKLNIPISLQIQNTRRNWIYINTYLSWY